ncbi:hypothetical protein CL655_02995 [bacterium]|nr:hypothetical protein [bacterium]|tara:strand:- start:3179 stop:3415 length:237 start_codon:yes stop_codon:yes gene_type:complete
MPTEPIFSVPIIETISLDGAFLWVFLALCVVFIAHAVVATYHWFTYGSERAISLLSAIIYIGVGGCLLIMMGLTLLVF